MSDPITLTEVPIGAAWNVQGDASRADFTDQVARQLSIALPITPNTTARSGALTAFWLAPRSWLVVAESADSPLARLRSKTRCTEQGRRRVIRSFRFSYRLSHCGLTTLSMLLATGCPLDLHPRKFRAGDCAQSVFGRVNALLCKSDEAPTFHHHGCAQLCARCTAGFALLRRAVWLPRAMNECQVNRLARCRQTRRRCACY